MRSKTKSCSGRVGAPDEVSAIEKAMEEFAIEPARRFRLVAEPVAE